MVHSGQPGAMWFNTRFDVEVPDAAALNRPRRFASCTLHAMLVGVVRFAQLGEEVVRNVVVAPQQLATTTMSVQ